MLLIPFRDTFLRKLGYFSDLDETIDSKVLWVVAQGGHFWYRKIAYWRVGPEEARNVRLAALNLRRSQVDRGGLGQDR